MLRRFRDHESLTQELRTEGGVPTSAELPDRLVRWFERWWRCDFRVAVVAALAKRRSRSIICDPARVLREAAETAETDLAARQRATAEAAVSHEATILPGGKKSSRQACRDPRAEQAVESERAEDKGGGLGLGVYQVAKRSGRSAAATAAADRRRRGSVGRRGSLLLVSSLQRRSRERGLPRDRSRRRHRQINRAATISRREQEQFYQHPVEDTRERDDDVERRRESATAVARRGEKRLLVAAVVAGTGQEGRRCQVPGTAAGLADRLETRQTVRVRSSDERRGRARWRSYEPLQERTVQTVEQEECAERGCAKARVRV